MARLDARFAGLRHQPDILARVSPQLPASLGCPECITIAREMRDAWRSDKRDLRQRLKEVAVSSGRTFPEFGLAWVLSVTQMPDEEMKALLKSHYPRVTEAQRKQQEHEATTGHRVFVHGWLGMTELYGSSESE